MAQKKVTLIKLGKVVLGVSTFTEFHVVVDGVAVGSAYERNACYEYQGNSYSRKRLIATLAAE